MELILNDTFYQLGAVHDVSVAVSFETEGLAEFGARAASRTPFHSGDFVGDVAAGGSCNCDMITFSPHLHGTHTECVGHIVKEKVHVHEVLKDAFIPAQLLTVSPIEARETDENYIPDLRPGDKVITRSLLEKNEISSEAITIRTGWQSGDNLPPFFTTQAMEYLNELGVQHLLVDMPSIDRLDDDGHLTNHHIFWDVEQGTHHLSRRPSPKTVTELVSVPQHLPDGPYMLNLQVAAFDSDAVPSRPLLFEILK